MTTPKTPVTLDTVTAWQCPECDAIISDDDLLRESLYECNACGSKASGEDGRRCGECNKFAAKIGDVTCPECEEGAPEKVDAYECRCPNCDDGIHVLDG